MFKLRDLALCWALLACGANAPESTGGFHLQSKTGACPAAYVIANSDFTSTNVSAMSPAGAMLSTSVISSGSAPPGLTTALSGDVIFPSSAPLSEKLVLIDRYPNSVITWVQPTTGSVLGQLSVGTGFAANPHDYLELSATKAYVSRYASNPLAGRELFDAGGDLLIINPQENRVTGRLDLAQPDDGALLPRADQLMQVDNEVWVALQRFDADFKTAGDTRLVGIDPTRDAVVWTLDLPGFASCGGLARSPSGSVVALACSGVSADTDAAANPAPTRRSGVVLVDATAHPPVVLRQFDVAAKLGAPLGATLAFASETLLIGVALGDLSVSRNDVAFTLDTQARAETDEPKLLVDAGAAFALGDVRCAPGCSDLCFLADAQAKSVHAWHVAGGTVTAQPDVPGDTSIGLPPRAIGAL